MNSFQNQLKKNIFKVLTHNYDSKTFMIMWLYVKTYLHEAFNVLLSCI